MADNNNIQTTVLQVEVGGAIKSTKEYKEYLDGLKASLLQLEKGTEEYNKVADELRQGQEKLNEVMDVAKGKGEAVEGSYDNLSKTMSTLKKEWKATADAAERARLAEKINDINDELKDMDASVGVFTRNVGNYAGAFEDAFKNVMGQVGGVGKQITQLIPVIKKATTAATVGLTGVKKAIAATGIGLLVTALGLLVANWDKVTEAIAKWLPGMRKANEETKALTEANEQLLAANSANTEEMEFQVKIMEANGATTLEILAYKKAETEALLANTEAQIAETNAKIESLKAHSAWHRFWHGENRMIKQLEESLAGLTAEQNALTASLTKLGQEIVIEEIKVKRKTTGGDDKSKRSEWGDLLPTVDNELTNRVLKAQTDAYNNINKNRDAFLKANGEKGREAWEKEQALIEERKQAYFTLANSLSSILGSIGDAWMDTVQAQMDAGKISEEEGKKQFEKIKALQVAEAIINTIAGAVGALMGITKDTGGWGIAAAVAQAAAITTAGMAQVKKIQNTTIGSNAAASIPEVNQVAGSSMPAYTQTVTNQSDIDNLANAIGNTMKGVNLSVSVTDIDNTQNKVRARETESTF